MRKGITATSAAIIIVIIFILLGTVTVTTQTSIQNAKKLVFAIEISEIQEEVTRYYKNSVDSTYPVTVNEYSINLSNLTTGVEEQFESETQDASGNIKVYEVDLTLIGITDTKYGNKDNANDVYVLSKETGTVYYLEGIKANSTTYYTLTQDLIDIRDRNDNADKTSNTNLVITTGGITGKILSNGEKNIYVSNLQVFGNDIKTVKYENGIIDKQDAKTYFKNNGTSIKGDRIKLQEEEIITIYAENIRGEYVIKYEGLPKIPEGFYYVGGSISTGAVISDNIADSYKGIHGNVISDGLVGNQFVWIPVEYTKLNVDTNNNGYDDGFEKVFKRLETEPSFYEDDEGNILQYPNEVEEYEAMYTSVENNRGFYIARYEAGDGDAKEARKSVTIAHEVVSKKGAYVYNFVPWGESMTSIVPFTKNDVKNVAGAVYLSQNMYKGSKSVVSTLCYGVQWDAVMNFIDDEEHDVKNSSTWGNYKNYNYNFEKDNPKYIEGAGEKIFTTGYSEYWKAKNIYDIAGNVDEWTMEAAATGLRVRRGGNYWVNGSGFNASVRYSYNPFNAYDLYGFRPALYLI